MANYTLSATGTAANLAAALDGDPTVNSECLSLAGLASYGGGASAGDHFQLADDGGVYRGTLPIFGGSAADDIYYEAYSGDTPELRCSSLVGTWTVYSGSTYQATVTTEPEQVFIDGNFGDRKISIVACVNEYDWFWASNVLYLYAPADPDTEYTTPGVEASDTDRGISESGTDYVTVDGLVFSHANRIGTFFYSSSNVTFKNTTVQWSWAQGLYFSGNVNCSDILVEDCIGRYNGTNGISINTGGTADLADCTVRRCEAYENGRHQHNNPSTYYWEAEQRFCGGILYFTPGDAATCTNVVTEYCKVYDNGTTTPQNGSVNGQGIWYDSTEGTVGSPNIVRFNTAYGNNSCGIYCELADYTHVYGNLFYDNAKGDSDNGFAHANMKVLGRGDDNNGHSSENNLFYNNTCYGGLYGIHCVTSEGFDDTPTPHVTGNIFKNNIIVGASAANIRACDGGDNDGTYGSGNVYDNNCLGAEASLVIRWGSDERSEGTAKADYTTYDSWETEHGESWTQIEADPSFTDSDNDDYTLASDSPCIGAGENLGSPYDTALMPTTVWPSSVVTGDQDDY